MLEKNFQRNVIKWLEDNGHIPIKYVQSIGTMVGVSDLIVCLNGGKYAAIELKVNTKLSPSQELWLKKINDIGGCAFEFRYSKEWKTELKNKIESLVQNG